MKARKILKNHQWFPGGTACSCGPVHKPHARIPVTQAPAVRKSKDTMRNKWAREMRLAPCHYCGGVGGTIDHIIPRSDGGRMIRENCVPACQPCNNWRGNYDYEWFKQVGWKTRPFAIRSQDSVAF